MYLLSNLIREFKKEFAQRRANNCRSAICAEVYTLTELSRARGAFGWARVTAVHMDLLWPALLALTLYTLNLPLIALLPAMLLLHRVMARLKARPLETATDLNVIIVGAGVSGLCMGKKLKEEGAKFTILEKSPRLGGTWWENTYPGCGCDVPSHLYSFSFLPNPDWSRVYSGQEEILNYLKRVAEKFNLVEHIQFGQRVTRCDWDPEACRWKVGTEKGVTFTARVLVSGQGALHVPKTPNFPDADSFTGSVMHTAR